MPDDRQDAPHCATDTACPRRRGDRIELSFAVVHDFVHGTSRHFTAARNLVATAAQRTLVMVKPATNELDL